jgi:spoIIIJ-associated protein
LLNQWKILLGWEDLSWTVRNGETGDIALVLDAASGEKLQKAGDHAVEALQHLLNAVRSKSDRGCPRVFLEVEGQAEMDERRIIEEAHNAAAEVKRTGEPFRMAPMDSRDRRLVHQALANSPDVETASEGEGQWRKVVVRPKDRG